LEKSSHNWVLIPGHLSATAQHSIIVKGLPIS